MKLVKQSARLRKLMSVLKAPRERMTSAKERAVAATLDKLFDRVEGGSLAVRVPGCKGVFEIDARSCLLKRVLKNGTYEQKLVDLTLQHLKKDRDAIDVGANVGFFTVLLARSLNPGRKVVAVEPTPNALKFLRANLHRNGVDQSVVVFDKALTNKRGKIEMQVIAGKEEYSSLFGIGASPASSAPGGHDAELRTWAAHAGIDSAKSATISVSGETLDALVQEAGAEPGFIKIDAEGAEYLILQGARKTLEKWKPVVLSELVDMFLAKSGASSSEVIQYLKDLGYDVFDADEPSRPFSGNFRGTILALPRSAKL